MKLKSKIEISKKEVSDIDISADKKYVSRVGKLYWRHLPANVLAVKFQVSCVSKDGKCKIWNIADGKVSCSLDLPPEDERKFLYKRCKYVTGSGLFFNEIKRSPISCFLVVNNLIGSALLKTNVAQTDCS